MASQKLTDRTELDATPASGDLLHLVDISDSTDSAAGTSKKITVDNLISGVITSPISTNPVENSYANLAAMYADQANQTINFFQVVNDTDYYEYLGTTVGDITDYRLLSDSETLVVEGNSGWRVFKIQKINDDSTPMTSVTTGKIGIDYNTGTGKVTSILFNKPFSDTISNVDDLSNLKIHLYNQVTRVIEVTSVTSWTTVGAFSRANVGSEITATNLSVNDKVEVSFDESGSGGATQLSGLSDVVSATNTNRFALVANGTTGYVGRALVEADISDLQSYVLPDDYTTATTASPNIDWTKETHVINITGATTLTESNLPTSTTNTKVITLYISDSGTNTLTLPANWTTNLTGTFDSSVLNQFVVEFVSTGVYWVTINQAD